MPGGIGRQLDGAGEELPSRGGPHSHHVGVLVCQDGPRIERAPGVVPEGDAALAEAIRQQEGARGAGEAQRRPAPGRPRPPPLGSAAEEGQPSGAGEGEGDPKEAHQAPGELQQDHARDVRPDRRRGGEGEAPADQRQREEGADGPCLRSPGAAAPVAQGAGAGDVASASNAGAGHEGGEGLTQAGLRGHGEALVRVAQVEVDRAAAGLAVLRQLLPGGAPAGIDEPAPVVEAAVAG